MLLIRSVADKLGIPEDALEYYGKYTAKLRLELLENPQRRGRLILVTAITPTSRGEGKTVVSIGLTQALEKLGRRAAVTLRRHDEGRARRGGEPVVLGTLGPLRLRLRRRRLFVLVEERVKGMWRGRDPRNRLVFFADEADWTGKLASVRITRTGPWSLSGELESNPGAHESLVRSAYVIPLHAG